MAPAVPAQIQGIQTPSRYWVVPAVRAVIALIAAVVVTFTQGAHTPVFGLVVFGCFAIADGIATAVLTFVFGPRSLTRTLFVIQGAIGVVAGVLALTLASSGLGLFLYLVTVWGALTGFLELYSGLRDRGRDAAARDWLVTGALTAVLALVLLLVPADALLAVGLFGAWAVIVGVFQGIGAVSLRSATRSHDVAGRTETS
ncbi:MULTISPECIES: DUF308 domain-containing protein [unclassified Leifsonia]|uniref:DUF308 domain-containing protein n=1 Tax=unclassified Leifsonia TaxID=2663824 RepID=UPI000A98370D|nr:DUF308 domain-containing protein [Leifsonia sp. 71-9]